MVALAVMTSKQYRYLLLFSLFGIAQWFFGNLYEGVVIAPNMLENSVFKTQVWQSFFRTTNPIHYYIPLTQVAILAIVFLYFKTPLESTVLKKRLKFAMLSVLLALVLSVYIITQINLKLFFGSSEAYSQNAHSMSVMWNVLNAVRLVLLGIALSNAFKAYMYIHSKR
jgi:hypothetical protein